MEEASRGRRVRVVREAKAGDERIDSNVAEPVRYRTRRTGQLQSKEYQHDGSQALLELCRLSETLSGVGGVKPWHLKAGELTRQTGRAHEEDREAGGGRHEGASG